MGLFEKERDLNRPPDRIHLEVDGSFFRQKATELHVRLDQFLLAHLTWRSRTSIQALIKDGFVEVDISTPDHPKGSGETTTEKRPRPQAAPRVPGHGDHPRGIEIARARG